MDMALPASIHRDDRMVNKFWYIICPLLAALTFVSMVMNDSLDSPITHPLAFATEILCLIGLAGAPWIYTWYKRRKGAKS